MNIAAFLACLVVVIVFPRIAEASTPNAVRVAITRIEWEPNKVAPRAIRLHGPISLWNIRANCTVGGSPRQGHAAPVCGGYLYYRCPDGKEQMCKLEWDDLEKARAMAVHATFGVPELLPRVRRAGDATTPADEWSFNMGVFVDEPLFCTEPKDWICPAGDAVPAPAPDAAPTMAPNTATPPEKPSACNYGGGTGSGGGFLAFVLAAGASILRRLRRRSRSAP